MAAASSNFSVGSAPASGAAAPVEDNAPNAMLVVAGQVKVYAQPIPGVRFEGWTDLPLSNSFRVCNEDMLKELNDFQAEGREYEAGWKNMFRSNSEVIDGVEIARLVDLRTTLLAKKQMLLAKASKEYHLQAVEDRIKEITAWSI